MGNFDGVHLGHQSVLALAHAAAAELGGAVRRRHLRAAPAQLLRAGRAAVPADDRRRAGAAAGEARGRGALRAAVRRGARGARARRPSPATCWPAGSGCGTWWSAPTSASARGARATSRRSGRSARRAGFGVTVAPLVSDGAGRLSPRPRSAPRWARGGPRRRRASSATGTGSRARCEHGDKRGRALGFPDREPRPRRAAPAAVRGLCGAGRRARPGRIAGATPGVASIGVRPTFGENAGRTSRCTSSTSTATSTASELSVALVAFQRPELKFDGAGAAGGADAARRRPRRARGWRARSLRSAP